LSKVYFKRKEFVCHHCGKDGFEGYWVVLFLNGLRNMVGRPVIITSGYRCEEHNKAIGGSKNSMHVRGLAVDFYIKGMDWNVQKAIVLNAWIKFIVDYGITLRLGIYEDKKFFHIDEKPVEMLSNDSLLWVKDRNGYHYGNFDRERFEEGIDAIKGGLRE